MIVVCVVCVCSGDGDEGEERDSRVHEVWKDREVQDQSETLLRVYCLLLCTSSDLWDNVTEIDQVCFRHV